MSTLYYTHYRLMALCLGLPGWAGTRRNIHPLTPILFIRHPYQLPPSTTIYSILLVQFTCLTVLFHNLSPGPLWSFSLSEAQYTMRQKKNQFSFVSIYFNAWPKLVNFFTYIKKSISYNSEYLVLACFKNFVMKLKFNNETETINNSR